jgi:hypothetical protein
MTPITVAERSKAKVCGRSLAGVAGSKRKDSLDKEISTDKAQRKNKRIKKSHWEHYVSFFLGLCVVRYRSLRLADHSSRGVLPTIVCHCV